MMGDALIQLVDDYGFRRLFPVVIMTTLRPLGLLFGFVLISWSLGPARTIRISMAVALGLLPTMVHIDLLAEVIIEFSAMQLAWTMPREFFLGYSVGFLASLPFFSLQWAGAITDQYRGESDSGIIGPNGETITIFGLLYFIIAVFVFSASGGFWFLLDGLYRSYEIWPVGTTMPTLATDTALQVMALLGENLLFAIQVAVPLLCLMLVIEFMVMVGARIAKRFNFNENAFLLKNFAAILVLPIVGWTVWRGAAPLSDQSKFVLLFLERFLQ